MTASYARDSFETTVPRDFQVNGFAAALTAFFADPDVKLALSGVAPPAPVATLPARHLPGGSFVTGSTLQKTDALKAAVATISSDNGSGSGFYVADGYLLTNRHVVGSSKYVKVKLANGKELVGEVNPGNSGGPLINAQGNAIGLTALKINGTTGLAFLCPAATRWIASRSPSTRHIERPGLARAPRVAAQDTGFSDARSIRGSNFARLTLK